MKNTPLGIKILFTLFSLLLLARPGVVFAEQANKLSVNIKVDTQQGLGKLKEIYRFFGADEPNYAYMKDGRKLLGDLGTLHQQGPWFRAHNLMTSGPGAAALKWGSTNMYREDDKGKAIYDWQIVDLIFDTYLAQGVRPYVQMGFMPQALSSKPEPYQHQWRPGFRYEKIITGWAYPPKNYQQWSELCYQWAKHVVERYGKEEVEKWYWQTWNEPNTNYWQGSKQEFFKLHDYAVVGVLRALPTAKIGGPHTAGWGGEFARDFYQHNLRGTNYATGKKGSKLDFVSFHAKGSPKWQGNFIRMGIANQLRHIDKGFELIASFPELRNTEIIIGESDPEGCAACQGKDFSYRNGTMYSSYTAASFARKHDLASKHQVNFEGALSWSFTFEDQPYFAGFRQMASNGIGLPVLNVMRMFSKMNGERIQVTSDQQIPLNQILQQGVRDQADIGVLASKQGNKVFAMVWHYHDDDVPGPSAEVNLTVNGLLQISKTARLKHYRVDKNFSNAYTAWQNMGSPTAPNEEQYAELLEASQLKMLNQDREIKVNKRQANITFKLPRQGVSLLVLEQ